MYVVGKSGTGKTTLLRNLIIQDIEAGRGVGLIDPHGDLAEDLLAHIPRHRTEDVVYFDPADTQYPVAFNPLNGIPPERRHLVASGIVEALKGIWPDCRVTGKSAYICFHSPICTPGIRGSADV